MPEIINDEKQKKALQQVSDDLATVETINTLLRMYQRDNGFVIAAVSHKKTCLTITGIEAGRVRAALVNERDRRVRSARTVAKKQRIALSAEDEDILRGDAAETPSEAAGALRDDRAVSTHLDSENGTEGSENGEMSGFN